MRAQQGLELSVAELRRRFEEGIDANELIRRHPWWSVGIAGAAGALAIPPLLAVLRAPGKVLRSVGRIVRPFGRAARGMVVGAIALSIRTASQRS
jgi:hypothetical protein